MRRASSTTMSEAYEGWGVFPGESEPSRVSSGTGGLDGERRVGGSVREVEQEVEVGIRTSTMRGLVTPTLTPVTEPDVNVGRREGRGTDMRFRFQGRGWHQARCA